MFGGLRIDVSFLAMIVAVPAVLSPWLGHRPWPTRITAWWLRLAWLLLVLLEVATPQFIVEYDTRPNRLFVEYLVNPVEVGSMLWHGYKMVVACSLLVLILLGWFGFGLLDTRPVDRRLGWVARPIACLVIFAVCFLAARGTLEHRPINEATVAFSSRQHGQYAAAELPVQRGQRHRCPAQRAVVGGALPAHGGRCHERGVPSQHRARRSRRRTRATRACTSRWQACSAPTR